jgi:uncharacterized membrane-anchored protein
MPEYKNRIDWSTVSVTADTPSLVYAVKLTEDVDDCWCSEFDRLRDQLHTNAGAAPKGFWVNAVSRFGKELSGGMDPGGEDQVRGILDDLIERTNAAAMRTREAESDKARVEAARVEELQRAAQRATELLRSQD